MRNETMKLVAVTERLRPSPRLSARLGPLLRCLSDVANAPAADRIEDAVWMHWMQHRDRRATDELERATRAIVVRDLHTAECILHRLVARHPDFPEAWHKRATLYYMTGRDDASVHDLHRTLVLEPRHYGAIMSFAEICLASGEPDAALFAFDVALRLNPHLERAREQRAALLGAPQPTCH
jgi:Tfp pilus assembly protein PilF